jgi:hypothetical protein
MPKNRGYCQFVASHCKYPDDQFKRERTDKIATVLAIVLALVPWAVAMPVVYRYPLMGLSLISILYLVLTIIPTFAEGLSTPQKIAVGIGVLALSFAAFWPLVHRQWKAEQANLLEGDLKPQQLASKAPDKTIQIGNTIPRMNWHGEEHKDMFTFLYDAGVRLEVENNELKLTTPVRDRQGHLVAQIDKNHWSVTNACLDENYTRDSLEILDSRGHVILQMRVLPDRIQLQGEWRDEFGNGVRLMDEDGQAGITIWKSPQAEQNGMKLIQPLFQYPSVNHWGETRQSGH